MTNINTSRPECDKVKADLAECAKSLAKTEAGIKAIKDRPEPLKHSKNIPQAVPAEFKEANNQRLEAEGMIIANALAGGPKLSDVARIETLKKKGVAGLKADYETARNEIRKLDATLHPDGTVDIQRLRGETMSDYQSRKGLADYYQQEAKEISTALFILNKESRPTTGGIEKVSGWTYLVPCQYYVKWYAPQKWALLYSLHGNREYSRVICKLTGPKDGSETEGAYQVFVPNQHKSIDETELNRIIAAKPKWNLLLNAYNLAGINRDYFKLSVGTDAHKWEWDFSSPQTVF